VEVGDEADKIAAVRIEQPKNRRIGGTKWHGGADAIFSRSIAGGGDCAWFGCVSAATDYQRKAAQLGVALLLNGGEESVHIDVCDAPHGNKGRWQWLLGS